MRVKTRAVILLDGRLVVARQRIRGRVELTLPGGRVKPRETVTDALVREVAEETGLEIDPGPLLYVAEIVDAYRTHDLELIYLGSARGAYSEDAFELVNLTGDDYPAISQYGCGVGAGPRRSRGRGLASAVVIDRCGQCRIRRRTSHAGR